jgi:hypothetical protein
VQQVLHVECDLEPLLMKSGAGAGVGGAAYARGLIEAAADLTQVSYNGRLS